MTTADQQWEADRAAQRARYAPIKAELERELDMRRRLYPDMVRKNSLSQADADWQLAIWAEIIADMQVVFWQVVTPDRPPSPWAPVKPNYPWFKKIEELRRELGLRQRIYPRSRDLPREEAERRIAAIQAVHDIYWLDLFGFTGTREEAERHFYEVYMPAVEGKTWWRGRSDCAQCSIVHGLRMCQPPCEHFFTPPAEELELT